MYDFVILGGGIVGLSTAWQLKQRQPDKNILVLEKEDRVASHQTGRNSGVIHAGIYYEPGSLKAEFCKAGVDATIRFCQDNDVLVACGGLMADRIAAMLDIDIDFRIVPYRGEYYRLPDRLSDVVRHLPNCGTPSGNEAICGRCKSAALRSRSTIYGPIPRASGHRR